ncbi:MAG: outer membrane protein assembly factor BamE [Nitrospinota bacterium]|nr:MAG: outer membrane protein assembly factor BamE [Nitrospinota bacterium]
MMKRRKRQLAWSVLFLSSLLLGGCAFGRAKVGERLLDEQVQQIEKGVTSKAEVVRLLGPPYEVSQTLTQEVFHYTYTDGKLAFLLIFARANVKSDDLYIFFDDKGIVQEVIFGRRTDKLPFQFWPFGE